MLARLPIAFLLSAACASPAIPSSEASTGVDPAAGRLEAAEDRARLAVLVETSGSLDSDVPPGQWDAWVHCDPTPDERRVYEARQAKSIVDAQPCRRVTTARIVLADGRSGTLTLVDLAPTIHVWLLLTLAFDDGTARSWHVENPSGPAQRVRLAARGLLLTRADGESVCDLWSTTPTPLEEASASGIVYAPLCGGVLAVRNPGPGQRTVLERTTDFLRDHVWGGEQITTAVKVVVVSGQGRETAELGNLTDQAHTATGPSPAQVAPEALGRLLATLDLGLPVDGDQGSRLEVGTWSPVTGVPGVWAGVVQPRHIHPDVLALNAPYTNPLDPVEAGAFVYSAAFDLAAFDLGYELGTEHPRVGWSNRVPAASRDLSIPGPGGYAEIDPLVRTGLLDPAFLPDEVALFVAGFKRDHGAFSSGALAGTNQGSHYGFVVFGTELSRLQPGLATLVVDADGTVDLRTWTEADAMDLWRVRHARQNGVALVEPDPATGEIHAGALVKSWSDGNWSGSVDRELRSMRGAVCLQENDSGRYLIYSVFASATPSAMAQVFAAYGCRYAMMLDMNALEHTYLSITAVVDGETKVHHLVEGMEVLDKPKDGAIYPRFVGYADNRDFFYMLRKPAVAPRAVAPPAVASPEVTP